MTFDEDNIGEGMIDGGKVMVGAGGVEMMGGIEDDLCWMEEMEGPESSRCVVVDQFEGYLHPRKTNPT